MRWAFAVLLASACGRLGFDPITTPTSDSVAGPITYSGEVLADHPVAYWRLDETAPVTAIDATGNGNDASYVGMAAVGVPGAIPASSNGGIADTAASFDGASSVDAGDRFQFPSSQPYSLEAWFHAAKNGGYQAICGRLDRNGGGTPINGYALELYPTTDSRGIAAYRANGVTNSGPSAALPATSWVHVVSVYDSSNQLLYVNGDLVMSAAGTSIVGAIATFQLASDTGTSSPLTGSLDEVAVYDYALDPSRILAHYHVGTGQPP